MKLKQMGDMVWCEDQAEGAIPNGTLIEKQNSEEGDYKTDGSIGCVVGSVKNTEEYHVPGKPIVTYVYWVRWSEKGVPVVIVDWKLKEIKK